MWTGDSAGYEAMHLRLRRSRGSARKQLCVECGGPAEHWALFHNRENALVGEKAGCVMLYSLNPADYEPMCAADHKVMDAAYRKIRSGHDSRSEH